MKKGAPSHPKTRALARALDISICHAVGILECLWHFVMEYCPCGDVGRFTNNAIAEAVFWEGESDGLVKALVAERWLDVSKTHRFIIHDWNDHAADFIHTKIARSRQVFASGHHPKLIYMPSKEKDAATKYYNGVHQNITTFTPLSEMKSRPVSSLAVPVSSPACLTTTLVPVGTGKGDSEQCVLNGTTNDSQMSSRALPLKPTVMSVDSSEMLGVNTSQSAENRVLPTASKPLSLKDMADAWYAAYPVGYKVGKDEALRAAAKKIKAGFDFQKGLDHIAKWCASHWVKSGYSVYHPATFSNNHMEDNPMAWENVPGDIHTQSPPTRSSSIAEAGIPDVLKSENMAPIDRARDYRKRLLEYARSVLKHTELYAEGQTDDGIIDIMQQRYAQNTLVTELNAAEAALREAEMV